MDCAPRKRFRKCGADMLYVRASTRSATKRASYIELLYPMTIEVFDNIVSGAPFTNSGSTTKDSGGPTRRARPQEYSMARLFFLL
jgi:hypothetical protein